MSHTCKTREKLLTAAGQAFAAEGFHNARVREICREAGANVAAVNYHFGDKAALYQEVLASSSRRAWQKYPFDEADDATRPADERLCCFVRTLMRRLTDPGRPAWHGKLMARELADPTPALDALTERSVRPLFERLRTIVRELFGPRADDRTIHRCASSVFGQCLFYLHSRSIIERLDPDQQYDRQAVDELAAHVTRFSLAAIRGLKNVGTEK